MRRARWFALAVIVCASAALAAGPPSLRLDEERVCLHLLPSPVLELPVVNDSGKSLVGTFRLEFLDTNGNSAAWVAGTFHEEPGTTVEKIPWEAKQLPSNTPSELAWHRLRYEFTPSADSGVPPARGVIQVGRVLQDTFELRMTAAAHAVPGAKYPVRVRVDNPKSGRPMAGIPVEVVLTIGDDDDTAIKKKVTTNSAGYATATFDLPKKVSSDEGKVEATATRGPFEEYASIDFRFPTGSRITLSTDKPLYQPGQTAHLRVTVFGPDKRALANASIKLTIEDEEGDEQFHQSVTTSRFGIASADWEIPQKMRLGDFHIIASLDSEDYYSRQSASIRISRYDLPTYTVVVTPDRPYYLPGQDASVEVRADYLFGKPVQRAKVRVVRRREWQWNYKDQKWEGEETEPVEGRFDATGKFVAHISLKREFDDFKPSRWQRFLDLDLAAYVTDLSTGRTEQRRFQLRLSPQPIHLYVLGAGGSTEAPVVFYVTSSYADGTPASVDGTISAALPNAKEEFDEQPDAAHRVLLGRFHTNRYGVGRVELRPLARELLVIPDWRRRYHYEEEGEREARLLLEAADHKGSHGSVSEDLELELGRTFMRVEADHALYRSGEPIQVSLFSNVPAREAIVDLSGPSGLLASEVVHLSHGRAQVTFPYDPRFHGGLYITAFAITGSEEKDRDLVGDCQVIFPGRQDLQLALRMAKSVFRPGEQAAADVGVRTPEGEPVESALGVLVFDRAVAERVRTDEQFGRGYGGYGFSLYDFLENYYGQSISGITYHDLLAWDSTQPFPEGLDLLAQALLHLDWYGGWEGGADFAGGGAYASRADAVFHDLIARDTEHISEALSTEFKESERYPHDLAGLRDILKAHKLDFDAARDPWDLPYRAQFSVSGKNDVLTLVSNGPDKRPGTADDFTVLTQGWPYFRPLGKLISETVVAYQRETHQYIRDYPTLRDAMRKKGVDLDALRDPWGRPYRFTFAIGVPSSYGYDTPVAGPYYAVRVESAGPDGIFDSPDGRSWDDVDEWTASIHYFLDETAAIEQALALHYAKTGSFPQSEPEFRTVLAEAKLSPQQLLDPWGHPYRFSFEERSRYRDQVTIETHAEYE
ncbi:MAG TPA: MG2 domain-containing protein, partial [Terriglobales bacterium]|nr:MG2 domain-containing protein [Terriglobales bacterium]